MPTAYGYTAEGDRFIYVEARPFLEIVYSREAVDGATREQYEAIEYLRRGAEKLHDRWTVGCEFSWDLLVFRCWIPTPAFSPMHTFYREVALAA